MFRVFHTVGKMEEEMIPMGYMSREDFASRLERAIARSGKAVSRAPLLLPPPRLKVE
jgi:hypothetical protein